MADYSVNSESKVDNGVSSRHTLEPSIRTLDQEQGKPHKDPLMNPGHPEIIAEAYELTCTRSFSPTASLSKALSVRTEI